MKYRLVEVESNAFYSDGPLKGVPYHVPLSDWVDDPKPLFAQLGSSTGYERFYRAVMGEDNLFALAEGF